LAQENRQLSHDEMQLRKDLKARVLGLAAIERSRRRQSSRVIWLREGDACTRFFHLQMGAEGKSLYDARKMGMVNMYGHMMKKRKSRLPIFRGSWAPNPSALQP
jgi:hypothetical protein